MRKTFIISLWMLLAAAVCSMAQNRTISGTVRDNASEPLAGVSVIVSGTSIGTSTDIDGNFTLSVPDNAHSIAVTCVGFRTETVRLTGSAKYNVILSEDSTFLDELVFVGYGTMKKKDLTGSVSAVDGKIIADRKTTEVTNALQGAVPGVTVTRTSSTPGGEATVRVRGITSMQNSSPLVIIDGVPGSISDVSPTDIQDIVVLKDAASAAIYGSRAAAGVILITTKRADHESKVKVDYTYSIALDMPTRMPEYTDAIGYMEAMNELAYNDTPSAGITSVWSREYMDNYYALHKLNPDLYPDTDWISLILKKVAPRQNHALNITAGSDKVRTKISLGYDNVMGLYTSDNLTYKRYMVRANNDIDITKWMTLSLDLNLRMADKSTPCYSPATWMKNAAPIYPAVWQDGRVAGGKDGQNPYGKMMYGGETLNRNLMGSGKIQLDIRPAKWLAVSAIFSPRYVEAKEKKFSKAVSYTPYDDPDGLERFMTSANTTDLKEARTSTYAHTVQLFANLNKSFGEHNIGVMAGIEDYYYNYSNINASKSNYTMDYFPYLSAGPEDAVTADNDTPYENAYFSAFGRITYNYASKYYLQANLRSDASGRFAKAYRWGFFPSVSAGWVISRENFMKGQDVVSFLKLRASYGTLGNERIGNYPYQSVMGFNSPVAFSGSEIIPVQGISNSILAIENITWETTVTYGAGIDMNFFRDRLKVNFDYYYKETKDMLIKLDIPTFMGYTAPDQNAGDMHTSGWDFNIGWDDQIGEVSYGVSFNLSDYRSVMGNIGDKLTISSGKIIASGMEYNAWYGYRSDGIFQNQQEIRNASALTSSTVSPGDIRYVDVSGANGMPDGLISTVYDRVELGGSLPRMNFGGQIYLSWRGIDFNLAFQGVGKCNAMLTDVMVQPLYSYWGNVPTFVAKDHWSPYNTVNQNLNAKYPRYSQTSGSSGQNYATSDFWMIDGSYLRIKDITLGYSLPDKIMKPIGIRQLRFAASLTDFFTFSHFPVGWDPEVGQTSYPITKAVVFSVNLKF